MAIRPTDLQLSVISQIQTPPIAQRAEEAPRNAQVAALAVFAAQTEQRNESVAETGQLQGNRIEVGERERNDQQYEPQGRRRRRPGMPAEEPVAESVVDPGEPPHLIDFTA
jgi:hypothetical protein